MLAHQQYRAKHAAGKKTQLSRKQDSGQLNAKRCFFLVESAEEMANIPRGKYLGQSNCRAKHDVHRGENDRERTLALGLSPGFAIARKYGDKGDGSCAAHKEVGNLVGKLKGRQKGIGLPSAAKEPGDVHIAQQPEDARQKRSRHQHYRCAESGVRMRGA